MKSIFVAKTKFMNGNDIVRDFLKALEMVDYDLQRQAVVNMVMNFRVP
jgi:hypothetical protein